MIQNENTSQEKSPNVTRYWSPSDGRIFSTAYAIDTETTLIDEHRPEEIPLMVVAGVYDGRSVYFLTTDTIHDFIFLHRDLIVVMHNAPFDLGVIQQVVGDWHDIYNLVENNQVRDTQLLHRLIRLSVKGTAELKGSSLEDAAAHWLNTKLDKKRTDAAGRQVRMNFGLYLKAPKAIPRQYLDYLADDVVTTFRLYEALNRQMKLIWDKILYLRPFGFSGREHLNKMWRTHGPLTHHIQLKAAIVLAEVSRNGLVVDSPRLEAFRLQLETELSGLHEQMFVHGYRPGCEGSKKALQRILRAIEKDNPGIVFPRTESGYISEAATDLEPYAETEPFLSIYLRAVAIKKLLATFLDKMTRGVLHPIFDVLKNTGRTSAFGDISAQNLPRDKNIRNLFVPSSGRSFIDVDYTAVEMATLAQAIITQFDGKSAMADAINAGTDLHSLVASRLTGKSIDQVSADERRKAKAVNFGLPGGMSTKTLQQHAKRSYDVDLTDSEARGLKKIWHDLFPEMRQFLEKSEDLGEKIAHLLNINYMDYSLATGQNNAFESNKIGILGWMARKVFTEESPRSGRGRIYNEPTCDYFWGRLDTVIDRLSPKQRQAVTKRTPSKDLGAVVSNLAGQSAVLTLTGRLRANATFCARHNTVFQGLAADGAKLAMWKLWRAGFRIVNFIHDEFLIEVPIQGDYSGVTKEIERLMIEGMKEVVPDVRVSVESVSCDQWGK